MESFFYQLQVISRWLSCALAGIGLLYTLQLMRVIDFGVQVIQPPTIDQLVEQATSYEKVSKKK